MMTDLELRKLARMIVQEQAENEQWMIAFAKAQSKLQKPVEKLVSPAKAAEILGISVWQLYHIKDDEDGRPRFSYVKTGNSQSSPLKFNAATILEEYDRYLSQKKSKTNIVPLKVAGL